MNKLVLPIILVAIVMIVGVFAFTPVDKASTVHDEIIDDIGDVICDATSSGSYIPGENTCTFGEGPG